VRYEIRPLEATDSFDDMTELLHRAYGELARMGFRFMATHQGPDITRERCLSGDCFVATADGSLIGTVTFYPVERTMGCSWYDRPEVSSFGQFAVEPSLQRAGIGSQLMDAVESRAVESGAGEIALDTAEGATHLIELYKRRGYREVGIADWDETNYQSMILSKAI
jgi:GNAT superfamily N-acetyltransferase